MAIVTKFEPVTKDRAARATTTECGHCTVEINGTQYLLLETYGSGQRRIPGKVSQSFHIDRERARELKAILETHFPGI